MESLSSSDGVRKQISRIETNEGSELAEPRYIVGIGSSAGGIEALSEMLGAIPADTKNAYIVVQHLSPDFKTMLPEILSRRCALKVRLAEQFDRPSIGEILVIPPDKLISIYNGRIQIEDRKEDDKYCFTPIDKFFASLAVDCANKAIGVILSGTGSDGTLGVQEIKKYGGMILIQDPSSAKFSGMPKSAAALKCHTEIASPQQIARIIDDYASGIVGVSTLSSRSSNSGGSTTDKILFLLRNKFGIDFSHYNAELIERRIGRRLTIAGVADLDSYAERLTDDSKELYLLRDDLLIGVTAFNRHSESLQQIVDQALPELVSRRKALNSFQPIRVWVVGCSTGEEAYTIGFLLNDYFKDTNCDLSFKIFATDVDEKALKIASRASFPLAAIETLPVRWRQNYFRPNDGFVEVASHIRERVVFANHNVTDDAPFPAVDLVSCRNLLMCLKPESKSKVLRSFEFSLKDNGYLLIGPSESVSRENAMWLPLTGDGSLMRRSLVPSRAPMVNGEGLSMQTKTVNVRTNTLTSNTVRESVSSRKKDSEAVSENLYRKLAFAHLPPSLVVSEDLEIRYFFGAIKEILNPSIGQASLNLKDALPPELFAAVEMLIRKMSAGSVLDVTDTVATSLLDGKVLLTTVQVTDIRDRHDKGSAYYLKFIQAHKPAQADPVLDGDTVLLQAKVKSLEEALARTKTELAESQSEMTAMIAQLEASNEELRATIEEIQSSTEELQSTNEELQAVNEELYTVNAECQLRISELSEMSSDVHNIYEASEIGTLFVDRNVRIRKFNAPAKRIFKLLPDDIGGPIDHFSSALRLDLAKEVLRAIRTKKILETEILGPDKAVYLMKIAPYVTSQDEVEGAVIVLIDISSLKKTEKILSTTKAELDYVLQDSSDFILKINRNGRIQFANHQFVRFVRKEEPELRSKSFFDYLHPDDRDNGKKLFDEWKKSKSAENMLSARLSSNERNVAIRWIAKEMASSKPSQKSFVLVGKILN